MKDNLKMKTPIIFIVDDDKQVLNAIHRDLRKEYRKSYRVMSTSSAKDALEGLVQLKNKNEIVSLFISDQRMPEMLGVEFLEKAIEIFPESKRVLLTAYSDIDAAIKAINDIRLDYYLLKPWDPPEEKLYPIINDLLDDWQGAYVPQFEGIKVMGYQFSPKSHTIKDFLSGNLIPYRWHDSQTDETAKDFLSLNGIDTKDLPIIVFEDGSFIKNPQLPEVASKVGMHPKASEKLYDVVIIGAGPAGLAAAVYGGSEGLKTLLIEKRAPGGQAGTSSRIENYLGFPSGLSGAELSRRAITQAKRFGVEFLSPQEVVDIKTQDKYKILTIADGSEIKASTVIITTGVNYRKLASQGVESYTGAGVYYGAATTEANACIDKDIFIVGGGNSAGQGAMYLSNFAKNVYIVIRKDSLTYTMSHYLIDQINSTPNIHLLTHSEIIEVCGNNRLESVVMRNNKSDEIENKEAGALFIFIGAKPETDWIKLQLIKNDKGYIETGTELNKYNSFKKSWKLKRDPFLLETCIPGVFAAGDVRAGAMNRVASAVGEGAMAIKFVHEYLAES